MQFAPGIFKAYDIRGLVGTELTPEVAEGIGRGLADLLETEGAVAVGYDMRPDSRELAAAVRDGLIKQGRSVVDIGQVATDMIYFAVGHYNLAGGAMVTASHNPGAYNGIKLCRRGAAPIGIESGLKEIQASLSEDRFEDSQAMGRVTEQDVSEAWIRHALSFVEPSSWPAYKIAIDAGNGMAGAVVPHLEGLVPLEITPMYFELDGTFPNHPANPLVEENNRDLVETIQSQGLDFGVAFDGDGDRAVLVDEKGRIIPGNIMSAILAKHFLKLHPGSNIIYDARNSRLVIEVVEENGGTAVKSRVGHSFIKEAMREYDAPFGGEFSGHYYFRDNFYADSGLIGALVAIQVLADSGTSLSELHDEYAGRFARSQEMNFKVEDKDGKLAELAEAYSDGEQDRFDGLTVNYPDWWFNVRPSNTEPYLRLNVEANSPEMLEEKILEIRKRFES